MRSNLPPVDTAASRLVLLFVILLVGFFAGGCEDGGSSTTSSGEKQVFGSAARDGSPEAGKVWQAALEAWPREGNLSILYGSPRMQAEFENWLRGLSTPKEELMPVFEKIEQFNDRLLALDGAWGPLPDPDKVRAMAVRGMRKTLWSDLRFAVVRGDAERATEVMVTMCNLPRVCHAFDGTTRGLLATLGTCDAIGWGMRDISSGGLELDEGQKSRLRAASSWLDAPSPFGTVDVPEDEPRRVEMLAQFRNQTLPPIMDARSRLLD